MAYPEEERADDAEGLRQQRRKQQKTIRKRERLRLGGRDEDEYEAPDTANVLLGLKNQRGEAGWDFEEAEGCSDDSENVSDFEDRGEDELGLSGDEEGDEILTEQGKEIQRLLEQMEATEESAEPNAAEPAPDGEAGESSGGEYSEGECDARRKRRRSDEVAEAAPPAPKCAAAAAPTAGPGGGGLPDDDELRAKAVACLKRHGGSCSLAQAADALGLTKKNSPLYQRVIAAIKSVASIERAPGSSRAMLVLRPDVLSKAGSPARV